MKNELSAEQMVEQMSINQQTKDILLLELASNRETALEILSKYASKDTHGRFFQIIMRSEEFALQSNRWQWDEQECEHYTSPNLPIFALKSFGHALIRWEP